ncbi:MULTISPECIES: outer membrane beta-barrel protein [Cysteiniphilum]|uniref:outer membrane beta-barrel protein n=1 Tax=Cysteiniphilum TaxID=2056696 RepID=UPI001782E5DC|nr:MULTISPECIES: hypothetical protein [Cysteiniphilum]
MKKQIMMTTITGALICASSLAIANARSGLVVGGQIGYAKPNVQWNSINSSDIKKGNLLFGAHIGFDVALSNYLSFGPEVGVFYSNNLSKISSSGDTDKVSNLIVPVLADIKLYTPIGINFFAKMGVSYVNPSASKTGSSYSINWKSSWNFTAAAGVGYQIGPVNIFAQYMHIFGKDGVSVDGKKGTGYAAKIDAITLGLAYTF